jgi:hypothetical protein
MVHLYWLFLIVPLSAIIGLGLGYGYRGLIRRKLQAFNAPLYAHMIDAKTLLQQLYESTETDIGKYKARMAELIAKIEKVLP